MYNHEPPHYQCPFCEIVRASSNAHSTAVVHSTEMATAFLALGRWPKNPVDVLVIPNEHFENLYDLPANYAQPLHWLTQAIALALKGIYHCDGISTRQHNEEAGDQDVWHYHVHDASLHPGLFLQSGEGRFSAGREAETSPGTSQLRCGTPD